MRYSGEHAFNYPTCFIHAGDDDHQLALDRANGILRNESIAPVSRGISRVQLNNTLKLMDANGTETLSTVRLLQTHAGHIT